MRLIILNQFFYPDHSATSQLMTDLAENFVEEGHHVTAVAGRGVYNGGHKLPGSGRYRGVVIKRAWATSFGKSNVWGRLSDYLSFYAGAVVRMLAIPKHDVIMVLTTPPLIGLLGWLVGRLRRMRVVMLMQDVYPDVAVELGMMRAGSPAVKCLDLLTRLMLRRADKIIVLGECMRQRIVDKAGSQVAERVEVIHNWADGSRIVPLVKSEDNPFIRENGLEGKFVVLFSGNLGQVNDFPTLLRVASEVRERTDIVFVFVGDGVGRKQIEEYITREGLNNVRLLPYQPQEHLRFSYAAGDVLVITLAEGLAGLSVPSKTYSALAAGRPLLFVGDTRSETANLIRRYGVGAALQTGNVTQIAATLRQWADQPAELREMGQRSRRVFEQHFDRPQAMQAYLRILEDIAPPAYTSSKRHLLAVKRRTEPKQVKG